METKETKVCKFCGQEKPVEEFYKNAWGFTSCCKECHKARSAAAKEERRKMKHAAEDIENARNLRLQDFTPRELMKELHRRGYEAKVKYVRVEEIDISKL